MIRSEVHGPMKREPEPHPSSDSIDNARRLALRTDAALSGARYVTDTARAVIEESKKLIKEKAKEK